jgi:ornithine cyclodeaminase
MRVIAAEAVHRALDYGELADRLRAMFVAGCEAPLRHHHPIATPDGPDAALLLMPAWQPGRHIGVKTVTVFPGNAAKGLPAVAAAYLLLDGATGQVLALLDGEALTLRRTAAISALAARFLAREDASRLLMVGAGSLAPHLIRAHAAVRPIRETTIWNRHVDKARALAEELDGDGLKVTVTEDLEAAVRAADVISCATLATEALVRGAWLAPGAHLDLVGAFRPTMRESDDEAVLKARAYVDTRTGAFAEAGDIVQPIAAGVIKEDHIQGDLFELCRGERPGRGSADEITLFKSCGCSLADLAAGELVVERT